MGINEGILQEGGAPLRKSSQQILQEITLADEMPTSATLRRASEGGRITKEEMADLALELLEQSEKRNIRMSEEVRGLEEVQGIDHLTGLYNSVCLNQMIEGLIEELNFTVPADRKDKATRENPIVSIAVVAMDLNKFKVLNDTYGHDVGDKALVTFASRLRKVSNRGDLLFRNTSEKGDEFLMVMPITSSKAGLPEALSKMKIADINKDLSITVDGKEIPFSAGAGYSVIKKGETRTAAELIQEADQNLIAAKKG